LEEFLQFVSGIFTISMMTNNRNIKLIAFHLPQFHPIPENNEWWGNGFTEWTNVSKAKPLFKGHHQPNIPADLGFYDLRIEESRIGQAELAREYGITGFCFWHYWFAGKRILEKPFNEILKTGKPDFPFCLGWANASWTGIWYGAKDRMLIEQTYPGKEDFIKHFYEVLPAFRDNRYITYKNRPIFVIHRAVDIPDSILFTETWRELASKEGLPGIHFVANLRTKDSYFDFEKNGYDACIWENPTKMIALSNQKSKIKNQILERVRGKLNKKLNIGPVVYEYRDVINYAFDEKEKINNNYPCVCPNWDNTPRSGRNGLVLQGSTPELFEKHFINAIDIVRSKPEEDRFIFIKSWNEWAEGNYLEPDLRFGRKYLEVIKNNLV